MPRYIKVSEPTESSGAGGQRRQARDGEFPGLLIGPPFASSYLTNGG